MDQGPRRAKDLDGPNPVNANQNQFWKNRRFFPNWFSCEFVHRRTKARPKPAGEREKYTVRVKKPENVFSGFSLTKACLEGSYLVS